MAHRASDIRNDPALVLINPQDVVTVERFQAWLDRIERLPPVEPGVKAADTLADIRASGEA